MLLSSRVAVGLKGVWVRGRGLAGTEGRGKKRGGSQGLGKGPLDRGPRARKRLLMVEFAASQRGCKSRLEREGSDDIADTVRTWSCSLSGKL